MTLGEILTACGVLVALLALFFGALRDINANHARFSRELGAMGAKVDAVWKAFLDNISTRAAARGFGEFNSPYEVPEESKTWAAPLLPELRVFYRDCVPRMTRFQLALDIQHHFGERVLEEVTLPHIEKISHGEALLIVAQAVQDLEEAP